MSENTISRRAALGGAFAFTSAGGFLLTAAAVQNEARSAWEEKNLKTILSWWKKWEGDSPSAEVIMAPFADDCVVRNGTHAEIGVEGKRAATALIENYLGEGRTRIRIDVTRTFVSGPMVVAEYNSATWNVGETPPSPYQFVVSMFVLKQGKIWRWIELSRAAV